MMDLIDIPVSNSILIILSIGRTSIFSAKIGNVFDLMSNTGLWVGFDYPFLKVMIDFYNFMS